MSCLHPSTTHIRGTTSAVTAAPVQRRGSVNSEQMEPRVQPTTGEPELEAVLGDDADPQAMFASMYKNFAAFKKRLNSFDDRLTVNTSICLKSNYFFSWLRSVSLEVVLETEADDGWGTVIAERDNEMIAVFGTCSHHTEAREATASFSWEEALPTGERSTRRKRGTSGSDGPPPPKEHTEHLLWLLAFRSFKCFSSFQSFLNRVRSMAGGCCQRGSARNQSFMFWNLTWAGEGTRVGSILGLKAARVVRHARGVFTRCSVGRGVRAPFGNGPHLPGLLDQTRLLAR